MSKKLVAYFSATGTTMKLAERLAESIGADIFEIEPEVRYSPADLDWENPASRSSLEMNDPLSRPAIANRRDDMSEYNIILLGFPIWWYTAPTVINSFLESYDMTGKTIIPFATSGGSPMGDSNEKLLPSCKNARLLNGRVLPADAGIGALSKWFDSFGI